MYQRVLVPSSAVKHADATAQVADCLAKRLQIDTRTVDGGIDELMAEYAEGPESLIVMHAEGHSRAALFDHGPDRLLRGLDEPIVLVGPKVGDPFDWPRGPMLICSDGSSLGEAIIWPAARLAKALAVNGRLITVTQGPPAAGCIDLQGRHGQLAGIVESVTGRITPHDVLRGSEPATVISDHARWLGASMIALTTHGRSGLSRVRWGSVAMQVIARASCPVLVQRPRVESEEESDD